MPGQNAVPLIVLSAAREPVEAVNGILRRAGQPAHCTWIPALRDLADALTQLNPELLVYVAESRGEFEAAVRVRDQLAPGVPVLLLAPEVDEPTSRKRWRSARATSSRSPTPSGCRR